MDIQYVKEFLGKTDMYLVDLLQKGYFDSKVSVLDAGCGKGRNIWMLANLGNNVEACDQNKELVSDLNKKRIELGFSGQQVNIRVGEIGKLPYRDSQFDFVICNAVLHFSKDQNHFENMMVDLGRVVKKNGVLFARFVSSHTFENIAENFNQIIALPDGTIRFVVDENWFKNELLPKLNFSFTEEFKTINIDGKRTMTTVVLRAK